MDNDTFDFLFKAVVIGDAGVGKTCVVQRFKSGTFFEKQANTIGVDFVVKTVFVDGKCIKLQIWDTAGQERFRTITQSYYRSAHGILIVFDVTKRDTFESVRNWYEDAIKYTAGSSTIALLVGNKSDLPDYRQVHQSEAIELARKLGMVDYIETSAKDNLNIEDCFVRIARELKTLHAGQTLSGTSARIPNLPRSSSSKCC